MTSTILPPRGAWIEREILYNKDLSGKAGWFYAQLKGLSWQNEGKATPWLTLPELVETTGCHRTAIYGYMTTLRTTNALRWRTSGDGHFMFTFPLAEKSGNPDLPDSLLREIDNDQSLNNDNSPEIRISGLPDTMPPETRAQLEAFTGRFGKFQNGREIEAYLMLVSEHGPDKMREVLQWAERKEAHLTNRTALLETLETAAAGWKGKKRGEYVKSNSDTGSHEPSETDLANAREALARKRARANVPAL